MESRLANRASWSFMFTPALDIYRPGARERYTDIDVLAAVDGKLFLVEVKRSFAGVNKAEIKKLVGLAGILRPDFAGFAVQRPRAECSLEAADHQRIERELADKDVRFLLWTSDDRDVMRLPMDIPVAFGRTMEWSNW